MKGWRNESLRHGLSAKGIKTSQRSLKVGYTKFSTYSKKEADKYNKQQQEYSQRKSALDEQGNDYSIGIIIPSTKNGNEKISNKEFISCVNEAKAEMSKKYGGTTSIDEVGSYVLEDGKLVEEKGVIVTSSTNKEKFDAHKDDMLKYAQTKGRKWTQESMAVTVETPQRPSKSLHFIATK
jgi:hypothetical protein